MEFVEGVAEISAVPAFIERLTRVGAEYGCVVQAFDPALVAGREHLRVAVERAKRAESRDDMIADDLEVEILCYAAGRRQINQAFEMGITAGSQPVVVVIVGDQEAGAKATVGEVVREEPVLVEHRDEERIMSFFGITDEERAVSSASLEELVIERVSLLVVEK